MHAVAPTDPHARDLRHAALAALFAATFALPGCGGSDDAASPAPSPAPVSPQSPAPPPPAATSTGRFIDSAVGNLDYACTGGGASANNGTTDALGNFNYVTGQTCTFSIGGVVL